MLYLILLALIIFIISVYLLIKFNNSTLIETQGKQAIRINLISSTILLFIVAFPIFEPENTLGRINFMQNKIENETHKWDQGILHSIVPKAKFDSIIDTIIMYHPKYRMSQRNSFDIVCFDIMYDDNLVTKFGEYLEKKDPERLEKLHNLFGGKNTDTPTQKLTFVKNKVKGKVNKSYGLVHNDTLINDKLDILISGVNRPIYTQYDFGNLCPPECDGFLKDILFIIYEESVIDSNLNFLITDTEKWKTFKKEYHVKN